MRSVVVAIAVLSSLVFVQIFGVVDDDSLQPGVLYSEIEDLSHQAVANSHLKLLRRRYVNHAAPQISRRVVKAEINDVIQ